MTAGDASASAKKTLKERSWRPGGTEKNALPCYTNNGSGSRLVERSSLMASTYKRAGTNGRVTWYVRYHDPFGRDIRKATKATTQREAEQILARIIMDIGGGAYEKRIQQRKVTFFDIAEDFLTYAKAHKRSWRRDQDCIKHLKAFFKDRPAADIRPMHIEDYILYRKKSTMRNGKQPAPATINKELACLRTIYNRAIRNEKLENNPMKHIKLLKENNKRDRVLTKEEFQKLLTASPKHLKPILIAAHETGMRAGEIFSLQWEQVDLESGFITLKPEQTKTNEPRKIPISTLLHETLTQSKRKEGSVFTYAGKSIASVKRAFKSACKKAGIKDFRFHDLRHTFITNKRKEGKQDRVIMAITGHKTISMLTRYDTIDEEDLKSAI